MRLIEKDAKALLAKQGICTPRGFFLDWATASWPSERVWDGPYYLKAQVLAGRRGKEGFVKRIMAAVEFEEALHSMRARLSAEVCAGFWCEEEYTHVQEWFIACDIDRATGELRAHVGQEGGKDVEEVQTYMAGDFLEKGRATLPSGVTALIQKLFSLMVSCDALSIELNPCTINEEGDVIILDAKIELDEAAAFRHPEWKDFSALSRFGAITSSREQAYMDLLLKTDRPLLGKYVELSGTIAVILAGGGASLVAMDALKQAGGAPANYLELSGNPDPAFLREAAKIVFSHPEIKAVWIAGSFANFTDIHATVMAILEAVKEMELRVPIVVRRDGPGADAAQQAAESWAKEEKIQLLFQRGSVDLAESAMAVVLASKS